MNIHWEIAGHQNTRHELQLELHLEQMQYRINHRIGLADLGESLDIPKSFSFKTISKLSCGIARASADFDPIPGLARWSASRGGGSAQAAAAICRLQGDRDAHGCSQGSWVCVGR